MYCEEICLSLYKTLNSERFTHLKVHSIFENAINIIDNNNIIFALLPSKKELRPYTLKVSEFDIHTTIGEKVYFQNNTLYFKHIQINILENCFRNLKLDYCVDDICFENTNNLVLLESVIKENTTSEFCEQVLGFLNGKKTCKFFNAFSNIKKSIVENDDVTFQSSCLDICGFGEGLTPSADDFLCGVFLVLYIAKKNFLINSFISFNFRDRTNIISENYLISCAKGLAPYSLSKLMLNVFKNYENTNSFLIRHNYLKVREFGATSGNDICSGILFCGLILSKRQGNICVTKE